MKQQRFHCEPVSCLTVAFFCHLDKKCLPGHLSARIHVPRICEVLPDTNTSTPHRRHIYFSLVMFDTVCIPEEMAHNEQDTTGTAGRPASQQLSDEASQACSIQARANVSPSMDTFGSASRSRAHTTPHESLFDRKSRMKSLSLNLGHDESSEYIFDNQRVPHSQQPRYSPGVDQFLALTEPPISRKYHREDRSSSSSPFTGQPHTPESSGSRNSL